MTSKTSIMLIIQQSPGIDYQSVLSKIAPNYANLNSARAALSRVLKDAVSFGMIHRKGNQLFLTDKGNTGLKVKMHDKLILKLNQLMNVRSVASNPGPLIQHFSILLERGRMDTRLLDNARAGITFSIEEVERVHTGMQENIRHLTYLEKTLQSQLDALRQLNFPSSLTFSTKEFSRKTNHLVSLTNTPEVQIEPLHASHSLDTNYSILAGLPVTPRGNNRVLLPAEHFSTLISRIHQSETDSFSLRARMGLVTLDVSKDQVILRGPSALLHQLTIVSQANSTTTLLAAPTPEPEPSHPEDPYAPEPVEPPKEPTTPEGPHDTPEEPPQTPPEENPEPGDHPDITPESPPEPAPGEPQTPPDDDTPEEDEPTDLQRENR